MRALIAADSFKEALAAEAVCAAIDRGLRERSPAVQGTAFPLADGGEGTLTVLAKHLGLQLHQVPACDPLGRPMTAPIGLRPSDGLAVIEAATVCGLSLLEPVQRNPRATTTYGLGQLVVAASDLGAQSILLGIGGTATNDGGFGMATALGWGFLDEQGHPLPMRGDALAVLHQVVQSRTRALPPVSVLCDVTNPLLGPEGATRVFSPQKGARSTDLQVLEEGLTRLAGCARRQIDSSSDPMAPGSGAAGGLGFGAQLFLNARLVRGIETILDWVNFDRALSAADVVITGEGRIDAQTLQGKLIHGIAGRCRRAGKPLIALCGQLSIAPKEYRALGLDAAYCIDTSNAPLAEKIARTADNLAATATRIPLIAI